MCAFCLCRHKATDLEKQLEEFTKRYLQPPQWLFPSAALIQRSCCRQAENRTWFSHNCFLLRQEHARMPASSEGKFGPFIQLKSSEICFSISAEKLPNIKMWSFLCCGETQAELYRRCQWWWCDPGQRVLFLILLRPHLLSIGGFWHIYWGQTSVPERFYINVETMNWQEERFVPESNRYLWKFTK